MGKLNDLLEVIYKFCGKIGNQPLIAAPVKNCCSPSKLLQCFYQKGLTRTLENLLDTLKFSCQLKPGLRKINTSNFHTNQ